MEAKTEIANTLYAKFCALTFTYQKELQGKVNQLEIPASIARIEAKGFNAAMALVIKELFSLVDTDHAAIHGKKII